MDQIISEARKTKLKNWIRNDFEGNVAAFVRHFSLPASTASYISQLFGGNRNFGEKAARQLESQTGMPIGWLDEEVAKTVPPGVEPPLFRYDRTRAAKLPSQERELVSAFIEFLVQRNEIGRNISGAETLNVSRVTKPEKEVQESISVSARRNRRGSFQSGKQHQTKRAAHS